MKLTPANARDAKPGNLIRDHEVAGLQLRCGAEKKSWQLYYTTRQGIERRPTLGHFPEVSLSEARERAKEIKRRVSLGEDPSGDWKAAREEPTVSDLVDEYQARWVAKKNGDEWAAAVKRYAGRIKAGLGQLKVKEVQRHHVDNFLESVLHRKYTKSKPRKDGEPRADAIKKTAPVAMNRCRAVLSRMFYFADEDLGWVVYDFRRDAKVNTTNPVRHAERNPERKRKVVATPVMLPRIAAALNRIAGEHPITYHEGSERRHNRFKRIGVRVKPTAPKGLRYRRQAACIWTILLTGARVGEILKATREELQPAGLVKQEHKTARHIGDKTVSLPRIARAMLAELPPCPSGRLFGRIRLRWIWERVRREADCPGLRIMDARRTFASYARSIGVTTDQLADHFGHTDIQTTHENYTFMLDEAKQDMVDRVAEKIMSTANGAPVARARFRFKHIRWRRSTSVHGEPRI
jgi:integrase